MGSKQNQRRGETETRNRLTTARDLPCGGSDPAYPQISSSSIEATLLLHDE